MALKLSLKFVNCTLQVHRPCILSRSSLYRSQKKLTPFFVYNKNSLWSCNHLLVHHTRQLHDLQHFTNTKEQFDNTQWNKHDFQYEDLPVDPLTASKHLTELINKGLHKEAEAKFELLSKSQLINNVTWNTWLTYIGKHYDLARLVAEYQKMRANNIRPSFITYSILILNSCKRGNTDLALKFLSFMSRRSKPNATIYNAFIKAYLDAQNYVKAREFCVQMQNAGVAPDSQTHKLLLNLFAALHDAGSVKKVTEEVFQSPSPPQPQTIVALITACISIQDGKLAREGLRKLIAISKPADIQTQLTPIITTAIEHNELDFLTLTLAVLKIKFKTQPEEHLLKQILNVYVKCAKIKESIDILFMIEGFQWTVQLTTNFCTSVKSILQKTLSPSGNVETILKDIENFIKDQKEEDEMATLRSRSFKQFRDIITKLQTMQEIQQ